VKFRRRNLKHEFEVLNIPLDSSVKEIEKAYKKLSKTTHPDRTNTVRMRPYMREGDLEHFTVLQQIVNEAYAKIKKELHF
jgi:DnaJ-class molecular chaperone